ncbi:MAG: gluconate 2-dehydrogenase subunit 3 family protein [Terracoccus sp.]
MRFFDTEQEVTLRAFCDVVLAQDSEPRVPVAESIDEKMATGQLDGYQYADMPDDRDTWKAALHGLDHAASMRGADGFATATLQDQEDIVDDFANGKLTGGPWDQMDPSRTWSVCMRAVLSGFYSHPWAWNEIGFGGPAYPRGYMRLGPTSTTEPFETHGSTSEDPSDVVRGSHS